jgi:transcriptional regulator with XRE-family HTH domain
MVIKTLGDRIRLIREEEGYTQEGFAAVLEVTPATINRYEKNHRIPDADFLNRLVSFCGCDPGWLLTGKDQYKNLGSRIRHYRTVLRHTREEFADLIGLPVEDLMAVESQMMVPTSEIITAVIQKTDINPQWLFAEKLPMRTDGHLTGEKRPFQKFGIEEIDVDLMWKVIEVMYDVTMGMGTAESLSDDKKGIMQKLLYDDAVENDRRIDEKYAALLSRLAFCDICEEEKQKKQWQEKWRIKVAPGQELDDISILVQAPAGLKCPIEGKPNEYISDSIPVTVRCTNYYRRLLDDGSLILVK